MNYEKRRYPLSLWLVTFILTAIILALGLWLNLQHAAGLAATGDPSIVFNQSMRDLLLSRLLTAAFATGLCLAAGCLAGCLLAFAKHRTVYASILLPFLLLAGLVLLYGGDLAAFLPSPLSGWMQTAGAAVPLFFSIALVLLPMAILCISSFALSQDPALYQTANSLGTAPFEAYVIFVFPRILAGALRSLFPIFLSTLGLVAASNPVSGLPIPTEWVCAILLTIAFMLYTSIYLSTRKPRRIAPC